MQSYCVYIHAYILAIYWNYMSKDYYIFTFIITVEMVLNQTIVSPICSYG